MVFFRARLIDRRGNVVARGYGQHPVRSWLTSRSARRAARTTSLLTRAADVRLEQPGRSRCRRGLWTYELTVINTANGHDEFISPDSTTRSYVLRRFRSRRTRRTGGRSSHAHAVNGRQRTRSPSTSPGTFVIAAARCRRSTLLYQNFPNPFGGGAPAEHLLLVRSRAPREREAHDLRPRGCATCARSSPARLRGAARFRQRYGRAERRPRADAIRSSRGTGATTPGAVRAAGRLHRRASTPTDSRDTMKILFRGRDVRFTTLGTGTISLSPARSCAGYLLETRDVRLLIDCGSGITRRLAELGLDVADDHARRAHALPHRPSRRPADADLRLEVRLPAAAVRAGRDHRTGRHGGAARAARRGVRRVGHGARLSAHGPRDHAGRRVRAARRRAPDAAIRFHTRRRAWHIPWSAAAGGSSTRATRDRPPSSRRGPRLRSARLPSARCRPAMRIPEHLTPEQCGELAAAAAPKHLALTHFYPPVEQVDIRALVGARFAGPVTLAHDGWYFDIEDE